MRFVIKDGIWAVEDLSAFEWQFLENLPRLAAGVGFDRNCLKRLKPDPLDIPAGLRHQEEGFLEDWREFVEPELDLAFQEARDRVEADVEAARKIAGPELPDRLEVPAEATDLWYSALNQARLLMNEAWDIADSTDRYRLFTAAVEGEKIDEEILLRLAQYEFYSAIQSILVENLMQP